MNWTEEQTILQGDTKNQSRAELLSELSKATSRIEELVEENKKLKGKAEITKEKQRGNRLKNDNSYLDTCDLCRHSTDWTCDFMEDCKGEGCSEFERTKATNGDNK